MSEAISGPRFNWGLTVEENLRWRNRGIPSFDLEFDSAVQTMRPVKTETPGARNLSREEERFLWHSVGVDLMGAVNALAI